MDTSNTLRVSLVTTWEGEVVDTWVLQTNQTAPEWQVVFLAEVQKAMNKIIENIREQWSAVTE